MSSNGTLPSVNSQESLAGECHSLACLELKRVSAIHIHAETHTLTCAWSSVYTLAINNIPNQGRLYHHFVDIPCSGTQLMMWGNDPGEQVGSEVTRDRQVHRHIYLKTHQPLARSYQRLDSCQKPHQEFCFGTSVKRGTRKANATYFHFK